MSSSRFYKSVILAGFRFRERGPVWNPSQRRAKWSTRMTIELDLTAAMSRDLEHFAE